METLQIIIITLINIRMMMMMMTHFTYFASLVTKFNTIEELILSYIQSMQNLPDMQNRKLYELLGLIHLSAFHNNLGTNPLA